MENERSSLITIGGEQYEMVLTTRATKAISTRYGGLDNLGDKLMKSENMEMALDEMRGQETTAHRGNRGTSHLSRRTCGVQGCNYRSYAERHKKKHCQRAPSRCGR